VKPSKPDAIVCQLHETPTDLSAWSRALTSMTALVSASGGGQFHLFDQSAQRMLFSSVPVWVDGALAEYEKEYNERLAASDPRRRMVKGARPGEWRFDQNLFDAKFMSRCEVYQVMKRYDLGYTAGARLASHHSVVAALGLIRTPREGIYKDRERRLLAQLSPHLVRAADLTMSFQELREKAELGAGLADALSRPVLVTDRHGRVLFENAAATRLLRERRGLRRTAGILRALGADDDRALEKAIADAVERRVGSVVCIGTPNSPHEAICRIVPLPESGRMSEVSARLAAIVSITTRGRSSAPSARTLEGLFGLTRAQCEVLVALLDGSSIDEIAAKLEITIPTVRSHLQQAFMKTGTRRQAELVALLNSVFTIGDAPDSRR
jgi:DNA-binding CsgD family transcriptional regulator/PAS domain-containing protein